MLDEGYAPLPDITVGNAFVFLCYCGDWAPSEENIKAYQYILKQRFTQKQ
jgi:hypothetical protein